MMTSQTMLGRTQKPATKPIARSMPVLRRPRRMPLEIVLAVTLANIFDLKRRVFSARWSACRAEKHALAENYGQFIDDLDVMARHIGQRISVLGGYQSGLAVDIARLSRLPQTPPDAENVAELREAVEVGIDVTMQYLQMASELAEDESDPITTDTLQRMRHLLDGRQKALTLQWKSSG